MSETVVTLIVAILGSNALTVVIQHRLMRKSKSCTDQKLIIDTLAAVTYSMLSNEVETRLTKGFATPEERRTINVMYDAYKANGWNGDMEARMKKVYSLPTADIGGGK